MKAATIKELKDELRERPRQEILDLCLRLARFKKENKELMTYHLFESEDEVAYIQGIENQVDEQFDQINRKNYYFIKKGVRKILKEVKKYIRYSPKKETEVELLLYFCHKLQNIRPSMYRNKVLVNTFKRQVQLIKNRVSMLHEDLQFEYNEQLEEMQTR